MDPDAVDDLHDRKASSGPSGECDGARVPHGSSDDPWVLDFSANTNPRRPRGVSGVYEAALASAGSYPAEHYCAFRAAAADYVDCEAEQVIPTAGAMAAIRLAVATHVQSGDEVLVPAPSFAEYAREIRLQGGGPEFVSARSLLETDPAPYAMAVVCQPNNPTGRAYDPRRLREFAGRCRETGTTLLVDEAFVDFTDRPTIAPEPGVIVARSLTKLFGLPGLRAGFAVATGDHRDRLDAARLTWGLSTPAAAVGTHCLDQPAFVAETRERVRTERERMRRRFASRFDVTPSEAPFLLLETDESADVDGVLREAREEDVAVRDARSFRRLDRHVRVAVRLPEENDRLLDALDV